MSNKLGDLISIQRKLERKIAECLRVEDVAEDARLILLATVEKACECVMRILIEKAKITSREDFAE